MPNQAYDPTQADTRTFGELLGRVVGELYRPDLQGKAEDAVRDAIRHWGRNPFFFQEVDNTDIGGWAAGLYVPAGYTIREIASDANYYIFVALNSGLNGNSLPSFTPNLFTPAASPAPIYSTGQTGTTVDSAVTWATVQAWPDNMGPANNIWTQLSTLPRNNQIIPPLDYMGPRLVEVTTANHRYELQKRAYSWIRNVDVIRPAPIMNYPVDYCWYNNRIYIWPYPASFYPITLSYLAAPLPPIGVGITNFWTTTAEPLIRAWAKFNLQKNVIYDPEAASLEESTARDALVALRDEERQKHSGQGIPASEEF